MQYLCNKHRLDRFYPTDPAERAMVDSAMFYVIGTLYPLITRATYPTLGFPQYPARWGVARRRRTEGPASPDGAEAAIAEPLDAFRAFFLDGRTFIGGVRRPSLTSALPPRSSSCAPSTTVPGLGRGVSGRHGGALGAAYSEPAADVRGFVASVRVS